MDAYGWQFDTSTSQGGYYRCNISGHSYSCTCSTNYGGLSATGYTYHGIHDNVYQNAPDIGNSISNNQVPYGQPPVQQAMTPPEALTSVSSIAPRVHVNPNYRPKFTSSCEPGSGSSKHANVHINPHWKGRAELSTNFRCNKTIENGLNAGVTKKTIFVNPRVLAHMKAEPFSTKREEIDSPELLPTCNEFKSVRGSNSLQSDDFVDNVCNNPVSNVQNDEHLKTNSQPIIPNSLPEPGFVVLSSTKIVRRQNLNAEGKSLVQKQTALKSSQRLSGITKKALSPLTSTLKVAKQVSSKYKFVRVSSSAPISSKITKNCSATPLRKLRRKSVNFKQVVSINPRSSLTGKWNKFVRKTEEDSKSIRIPGSLKQVKKVFSNVASSSHNIHKAASFLKVGECGTLHKNVKSRYKLTRVLAKQKSNTMNSEEKMKTVQSRYKLVRLDLAEHVPSSNKFFSRNVSTPGACCPPLLLNNRFRNIAENKNNPRRKVSRFRINQASPSSKFKAKASQTVVKFSRHSQSQNLNKTGIRRSGLFGNMIWQKGKILSSSQLHSDQSSYLPLATTSRRRNNVYPSNKASHKSLLNIGGVLYRSTRTTLTRTQPGESKDRVLHIRGKRYVLDGSGTTLRPASSPEDTAHQGIEKWKGGFLDRVDIGGVTFTRRNDNTLVRTNTHYARNLLSIAKMKSIALLTNKLRKNNQPCLLYNRFGRCNAKDKGKCWRVHDPKNIAICRKFLQGNCEIKQCLLSHAVGPEKMPTCRYYLEGCCVRDNCPYLHVKVNAHAGICREFLHGYCAAGDMCKKRHVYLCAEFEQNGKCSKGKCCPYPHKIKNKVRTRSQKAKYAVKDTTKSAKSLQKSSDAKEDVSATSTVNTDADKRMRYYYKSCSVNQEGNQIECSVIQKDSDTSIFTELNYQPEDKNVQENGPDLKRPKIGILPAYIPLE